MHGPLVITFVAVAAHLVGADSQGTSGVITGQTDDATKTWKPNEEERVPFQVSDIAEMVKRGGSIGGVKNFLNRKISKKQIPQINAQRHTTSEKRHNAERLFDPTTSLPDINSLIAASNYKIDDVVEMAFAKLGSKEETRAKEVLKALTTRWHKQGVHPANVCDHLGLKKVQLDKDFFTSPRYTEFVKYVGLFNVGKPNEKRVSAVTLVWETLIKKITPEEKKKVAGVFYSYLQTKAAKNEHPEATLKGLAFLSGFIFI